ncbi:MAG: hypothetical protein JSR91_14805 [Proteobacteria bacterium]|nr:hypothetical protein [Pseudomonadota bacterium]
MIASVLASTIVAEGIVRYIDGLPLFAAPLPENVGKAVTAEQRDEVPLAAGVSRDWSFDHPPPLPNRGEPSAERQRLFIEVRDHPPTHGPFQNAIHNTAGSARERAWVMLQQLIPVIERRLASGAWPKPLAKETPPLPTFMPRRIAVDCEKP